MFGYITEEEAHKIRARGRFNYAMRKGKIKKQPCVVSDECNNDVEGHHPDYDKPYDVIWACTKHHGQHHHGEINLEDFDKSQKAYEEQNG